MSADLPRRRLPPKMRRRLERARREEIPRVSVAMLGTSWYERGFGYWARRVWWAVLMLITVVCAVTFTSIIVISAWESSHTAGIVVGSIIAVNTLVSGVWIWRLSTPKAIEARAWRTADADPRGGGAGGGVLGAAAMAGSKVAAAIVFIGAALLLGLVIVLFLRSLGQQLLQERALRVRSRVPLRPH